MIKYLGSKRLLIPDIVKAATDLTPTGTFLDLFSGTSRVGMAMKKEGYTVHANDYMRYAYHIAKCYIEADLYNMQGSTENLIYDLNRVPSKVSAGFFTKTYAQTARFFQAKNTLKIEAIREELEHIQDPLLKSIGIVSLMEAADRVDSTCGIQMAYLKKWAARAKLDLTLRVPELLPGPGRATNLTAKECLSQYTDADITYFDPPYNQHSYLGNYHIWETLSAWDEPEVYGIAQKRMEVREKKSLWNHKARCRAELTQTLDLVTSPYILVSFSNKAYLTKEFVLENLSRDFHVEVRELKHPAYIGTKIGKYKKGGIKPPKSKANKEGVIEYLFLGTRK